ncbi:MAG: hypothetical protein U5J83_02270 [Bryobacterales bacterium]|nr:hypothetical protein [Bryobacterales bacterium]
MRAILRLARSMYNYTILDLGRGLNRLSLSSLELVDQAFPGDGSPMCPASTRRS